MLLDTHQERQGYFARRRYYRQRRIANGWAPSAWRGGGQQRLLAIGALAFVGAMVMAIGAITFLANR